MEQENQTPQNNSTVDTTGNSPERKQTFAFGFGWRKYKFVDYTNDKGTTVMAVELCKGKYRGMVYDYGQNIKFGAKDNPHEVKFSYMVYKNPRKAPIDKKFIKVIGDVLMDILAKESKSMLSAEAIKKEREKIQTEMKDARIN